MRKLKKEKLIIFLNFLIINCNYFSMIIIIVKGDMRGLIEGKQVGLKKNKENCLFRSFSTIFILIIE